MDYQRDEREGRYEEETPVERLADILVDSAELNAWEYGNTGNFMFN